MIRLLSVFLITACIAAAQSVTGSLVGTVADATGVVVGARIDVINQATAVSWSAASNANGDYSITNLPSGNYRVHSSVAGYNAVSIADVTLLLNQTVRVDIHLTPGNVQQVIEVTASTPSVQSESSSVAIVVDTDSVQRLPLNGRTLDTFVVTAPGNAGDSASNPNIGGAAHWGGTSFTVDGVGFNDMGNGGGTYSYATALATQPSLETIQEFKIESNSAKAEYGSSVAVSMVTKRGGNQLHGSLFEFNRNAKLASNQFFSNANGKTRPPYNRNEFGVSAGGPVIRNRTFFFGSYEGMMVRQSSSGVFSVPTMAQRQGDFSVFSAIKDPVTKSVFANNIIPASRIDARAATMLSYVPATTNASKTYNLAQTLPSKMDVQRYSARVDHNFNSSNSLSLVLTHAKGDPYEVNLYSPTAYGNYSNAGFLTKSAALTYTRTMSASMTNELRASYFTMESTRMGQNLSFNPATLFPDLFTPLPVGGLPTMYISGYTKIGDVGGADPNPQITWQFGDTLAWVRGSHTFKAGVDSTFTRVSTNPSASSSALGYFSFNSRYTGNAISDFLLGDPVSATRATATPSNVISQPRFGFYAQDDWKINSRLTLNYGIRYEVQTQLSERRGTWTNFNEATGGLVVRSVNGNLPKTAISALVAQYPYSRSEDVGWGSDVTTPDHKDFAPRFGFAFRPFADNRTVVRGGYGLFYNLIPIYQGIYQLGISNPPYRLAQSFTSGATTPTVSLANPFAVTPTVSANPVLYGVTRELRNPYSQQWNLTVERELPGEIGLRVSYLGNKVNRALYVNYDSNQPVTQAAGNLQTMRPYQPWANVYMMKPTGNAFTHQMQVQGTRRFKSGLLFASSFTWTKSLDDVPVTGTPQNPYDASGDRGNADGIRRFVSSTSASWELPFGPGKRFLSSGHVLGMIVGGWRLSTIAQLKSGTPFSVGFTPTLSGWYATRANAVSSNRYGQHQSINSWFDSTAFAVPTAYTFGNSARNSLFGPGVKAIDASLSKTTTLFERYSLEFRADAFNLPNTVSFGNPAADITVPSSVGRITTTTVDARTVQFGLKVLF
jgi:hypothetical protein